MNIALIGTGFIGGPLLQRLAARGDRADGFGRSNPAPHALDVLADGEDRLAEVLSNRDAVVISYAPGGTQDRRRLYVEGASRLLGAIESLPAAARPGRVVVASSTSALPDLDALLDETCEIKPEGARGLVQRDAEDTWRAGLERLEVPGFILRLAGLYGPGRELGRLYLRPRSEPFPGDGMRPTNLVHQADAVSAFVAALDVPPDGVQLIQVCDDDHTPRRVMVESLARAAGRPLPPFEREPGDVRGKRVDNAKMKRVLGLTLQHPLHAPR